MNRDLTPGFAAALAARDLRPVIFYEGAFASGPLRLWSGLSAIDWAGQSWSGAGALLGRAALRKPAPSWLQAQWCPCLACRQISCNWPSQKRGRVCPGRSSSGF
jgi:hypothetical protein